MSRATVTRTIEVDPGEETRTFLTTRNLFVNGSMVPEGTLVPVANKVFDPKRTRKDPGGLSGPSAVEVQPGELEKLTATTSGNQDYQRKFGVTAEQFHAIADAIRTGEGPSSTDGLIEANKTGEGDVAIDSPEAQAIINDPSRAADREGSTLGDVARQVDPQPPARPVDVDLIDKATRNDLKALLDSEGISYAANATDEKLRELAKAGKPA